MKKKCLLLVLTLIPVLMFSNPVLGLLERIDKGASKKFKIEVTESADNKDYFELDQTGDKVVVRGNNYISIATGINWYLKYYANIHLSWNGMTVKLPKKLPVVNRKEHRETDHHIRYYLNYCTFSYSMSFWDWERWQKEIDWMALHGINLPLSITGTEAVWVNVLDKLGYTKDEINKFIAGSGFLAWWQMNNLEGWGGPNTDQWYAQQVELQKKIIKRYKEYGMEPVYPGYAGMLPSNAKEKLGLNVSDPGYWGEFKRPSFLQPTDPRFAEIAELYYTELEKLFGKAQYYAIDPFHEGGSIEGVDLDLAGKSIMNAMKKASPNAVWVAQAWQANPRPAMVNNLNKGDLLVLDLYSDCRPMWGPEWSTWYRSQGYGKHEWIYCMLLNFGGRTGLYGKMQPVIDGYYDAQLHRSGNTLKGIGATMEAIENNPVMFELLFELPWREDRFTKESWLADYTKARYGKSNQYINNAWNILSNTVYNFPIESVQEGTTESVFAACPKLDITNVSCCSSTQPIYNTDSVRIAAAQMLKTADQYKGNNNFEYDLIDIVRQTIANRAYYLQKDVTVAYKEGNKKNFIRLKNEFLTLMLVQDSLLETRSEFMVGAWVNQAKKIAKTDAERKLYEWNARTQITVWGSRISAESGLNDYAYKEWSGILRDYYYTRWDAFFNYLEEKLDGKNPKEIDFYLISEQWTNNNNPYPDSPQADPIERAKDLYYRYVHNK
ncbi:alpha-N-acetylglucosaminidase [Dysgonomonas hofstadii]|uniref:Alpha-N-acetylglucosaminidase n=1 Tax=Dysgonomonas hofstadii TaxID=637886 RepID=A0A840CQZ0_9BACT|nr:alpha-N-acetylglucosaminidase [Dysgonomonas hofstadii]MBB4034173.1 alpha-N-acetylglucosaminidase [Dysgonomonas hofstadii]